MAQTKYRVAIIGTGRMGGLIEDELNANQFSIPYGHCSAYQAIPETEVIAVANRGQERLSCPFTEPSWRKLAWYPSAACTTAILH